MPEKSFTVKLGGDSSELLRELSKVERQINSTQKVANNLAKSLEYDFDSSRAEQAQRLFQKALEQTEEKAKALREELARLEEAGAIDTLNYSKVQLELAKTESKAVDLRQKLEELKNVQIEQLSKKFTDVGDKISAAGQKLTGLSVAAAGALAGVTAIGKNAATTGAEIDDMTQQFDISAETIQRWNYLALQAGVDSTAFTRALIRARAAMADLSTGTSNAAAQALESLGIAANEFGSDEEMFDGIIAALARVEDSTLQTAYANEIFGDRIATQLLPYINAGAQDLAKWNAEFDAMPTLTGEQAAALAELDDTFNRLNVTMEYASAQLGLAFAPIIERVVVWIEEYLVPALEKLSEWFSNLSPGMQNAVLGMVAMVAAAAPLLMIIGRISSGVGALIKLFGNLNKAQLLSAAGFAALAGAAALGVNMVANWQNMSWIEKLLNGLAMAALVAAAAVTVFHASWSLGIAIGAIAAAVTAGLATINAAKDDILPNTPDFTQDNIGGYTAPSADYEDYYIPETISGGGDTYTDSSSNDQYNITINISGAEMSAEEIADAVGRKIATLAQSRR